MGILESLGKVLDFFVSKRVRTLIVSDVVLSNRINKTNVITTSVSESN